MDRKSARNDKQITNRADGGHMICDVCNINMEMKEATFAYLGRTFKHQILRCPSCGQAYVPEALAKGRMREVEHLLEDK